MNVTQGAPQVSYKEAITGTVDHREIYKKQSGGRGKFADIRCTIAPQDDRENRIEFVTQLKVVTFLENLSLLLKKDLKML